MEHPLALFRNEHHLSQDDLANMAGITRQIVTLTEQGIYSEIPPSIVQAIKDEFGLLSIAHLSEEHHKWIDEELDKVDISPWLARKYETSAESVEYGFPNVDSFVSWRNLISSSVSNFGKIVKIQPVTIRKYESGATNNLPVQLVERLRYWGFSDAYIRSVSALPISGKLNQNGKLK